MAKRRAGIRAMMRAAERHAEEPALLRMFDRIRMPDAMLGRSLHVTPATICDWRMGRRQIPRPRQIQMLGFLVVVSGFLARRGYPEEAKAIDDLLLAELRRRRPGEQMQRFADDVAVEVAAVRRQVEPVFRQANALTARAREQAAQPVPRAVRRLKLPPIIAAALAEAEARDDDDEP